MFFRSITPSNAGPPAIINDKGEGSGTAPTASPVGPFSPVMKLALTAVPVVASYSPTLPDGCARPEPKLDTKRVLPETVSPSGSSAL